MMEDISFALSDYWRLCETWTIWYLDDKAGLGIFLVLLVSEQMANGCFCAFYVACDFHNALQFDW